MKPKKPVAPKRKPKIQSKSFRLDIDIYKDAVWLIWPANMEQARAWLKENTGEDIDSEWDSLTTAEGLTMRCDDIGSVIFLTEWKSTSNCFSVLSHEAAHAARSILRDKGIKECHECEEAFTYLLAFIIERLTSVLVK